MSAALTFCCAVLFPFQLQLSLTLAGLHPQAPSHGHGCCFPESTNAKMQRAVLHHFAHVGVEQHRGHCGKPVEEQGGRPRGCQGTRTVQHLQHEAQMGGQQSNSPKGKRPKKSACLPTKGNPATNSQSWWDAKCTESTLGLSAQPEQWDSPALASRTPAGTAW